jgi:hypothetical protein
MTVPTDDSHQFHTKYPVRFYEIVREALKDAPDSVVAVVPDDVLYKFARLIAEECADIAMELGRTDTENGYNELSDYGKGCADTTMILAFNLKFLFR